MGLEPAHLAAERPLIRSVFAVRVMAHTALLGRIRAWDRGCHDPSFLWNSQKRGVMATPVPSAYSSQEGSVCHYTDRKNRPDQRTFRCQVCGFEAHADHNAAINLSRRVGDSQLRACKDRTAIKAVLMQRHEAWKQQQGREHTEQVKRRKRGTSSISASST